LNTSAIWDLLKRYNFSFIGMSSAIFFVGIVNLYSVTHSSSAVGVSGLYKIQLLWYLISLGSAIAISFVKPAEIYRLAYPSYVVSVFLMILVLILGHRGMGAQRWLAFGPIKFQPSELMKITIVLALARWFHRRDPDRELTFKSLIIPALIAFVPAILIIVQPDLGTGMLIILIFFTIAFYRQLRWKTIFIVFLIAAVSGTVMYKFGLKEYQRKRIHTFIDPDKDAKGSGYNAIQSKIAIGSGQFFGKGFRKSSQAALNYLPENHTDFVFSIFNEEHGFFGSFVLISLYVVLLFRFIWLAISVDKLFNAIVAIGLMSI